MKISIVIIAMSLCVQHLCKVCAAADQVEKELLLCKSQLEIQTARLECCKVYHIQEMAKMKALYDIRNRACQRAVERFTELKNCNLGK